MELFAVSAFILLSVTQRDEIIFSDSVVSYLSPANDIF
jgi:hypothetical protein